MSYPKIELHVHLEGTLRPETLLAIAECNGVSLPATTPDGLADQFRFTDLAHFIDVWLMVTSCLRTADDFRRITVDYAGEAVQHGAVYVEGIFAPLQLVRRGVAVGDDLRGLLRRHRRRRARRTASRCASLRT